MSSIADLLRRSAARHPGRLAVADEHTSLSYAELDRRARAIAGRLAASGVRPGDRVLILLDNRTEYVQIEQALVLGGMVRVGINTRLHPREVGHIVRDAGPAFAFAEQHWLGAAGPGFAASLPCPLVAVGAGGWDAFLDGPAADGALVPTASDDLAWLMYTSGTTGTPKGVMHTHASVLAMVELIAAVSPRLDETDIALHTAPLSHMSGAIALAMFGAGGANLVRPRFDPSGVVETISRQHVSVLPVVPTQLNMLTAYLRAQPAGTCRTESIRLVPYAGSAIAPDRLEQATAWFGGALLQMYGSSESLMPITALPPADHVQTRNELGWPRSASAGRALASTRVEIRDEKNQPVPAGERGEIVVLSPTSTTGYWHQPAATAELREPGGWCHSGDIGVLDADGYLFVVDRKKDMIVTGGFNVYPREIEDVLSAMPGVAEVAVVSAPSRQWGESIVAAVTLEPGAAVTLEDVQSCCRAQLAGYKVPRQLLVLPELPKSGTGKILKREISSGLWGDAERRVGG